MSKVAADFEVLPRRVVLDSLSSRYFAAHACGHGFRSQDTTAPPPVTVDLAKGWTVFGLAMLQEHLGKIDNLYAFGAEFIIELVQIRSYVLGADAELRGKFFGIDRRFGRHRHENQLNAVVFELIAKIEDRRDRIGILGFG